MSDLATAKGGSKIEIYVESNKFSINDAYEMRQERQREAEHSIGKWAKMDDDHRDILQQIVRRAIESMHANTHQWLPHCLMEGNGGDRIDVRMSVLLSDIEAQVDMMVDATDFEIEATKRKIMEKIMGETPDLSDDDFVTYVVECVDRGHRLSVEETRRLLGMVG
jgi:hypothetical protein